MTPGTGNRDASGFVICPDAVSPSSSHPRSAVDRAGIGGSGASTVRAGVATGFGGGIDSDSGVPAGPALALGLRAEGALLVTVSAVLAVFAPAVTAVIVGEVASRAKIWVTKMAPPPSTTPTPTWSYSPFRRFARWCGELRKARWSACTAGPIPTFSARAVQPSTSFGRFGLCQIRPSLAIRWL